MLQRDIASRPGLVATSLGDRVSVTGSALNGSNCPIWGSYVVKPSCLSASIPYRFISFPTSAICGCRQKKCRTPAAKYTCMLPVTPYKSPCVHGTIHQGIQVFHSRCLTSCWSGRAERQLCTTGAIITDLMPVCGGRVELRGVALRRAPRSFY